MVYKICAILYLHLLIYCEKFVTKSDAYKRERQIKSYKGGSAFKKLIDMEICLRPEYRTTA